jgi:hypothetical protein
VHLIFVYGPPAAGKYTVSRRVAELTGLPLFHNHLVVDAVAAVFPFGSENFMRLREQFWMDMFEAVAAEGKSLIFTFQPENSVDPAFPAHVQKVVAGAGGQVTFVHLHLSREGQLERIANEDRAKFGKLRDIDILKANLDQFEASTKAMPPADLTIETEQMSAYEAAELIVKTVNLA